MNKRIKYMGIAAATLLTIAPIATPIFNFTNEVTVKAAENDSGVYKISNLKDPDEGENTGWISGTFPAIKDGKTIDITYNSVYFKDDGLSETERVRMPNFKGYSVDQEYVTFGIKRDPSTNKVTGITLPNGIPTYTKNGQKVATTSESNEAYQMSVLFPDGKGQERFSNSTDITDAQKNDAQKWENQMKSSFRFAKDMPVITNDDESLIYLVGSDGWFYMGTENLTPQSNILQAYSKDNSNKSDFFMNFNDNKDGSNIFFNDNHYGVFATATANDGSIKRNLTPYEINQFLEEKGGKGVTFHFGIHYVENPITGNGTWDQYLKDGSKQVASKDVVVLPLEETNTDSSTGTGSNNAGSSTNTGSTTNTGHSTNTGSATNKNNSNNTNTNPSTTTEENTNTAKTTTPAVSYPTVYSPTTGTKLYTDNGTLITNVRLSENTAWQVDKKQVIDGVIYLRVATNEWVKKDSGLEVTLNNATVNTSKQTILYTSTGKKVTNRALAKNTPWFTDRSATINGEKMYRVATDEWVAAKDIQ